jgi:dihydropteroate synthase
MPLDQPLVMGVVNVTPDSFFDGGRYFDARAAVAQARQLADDGADLIDIGGESTRPGGAPVSEHDELKRVLPVLEGLQDLNKPISVDTRKPAVMKAALAAGASMINDVEALAAPGALQAVAQSQCAVCLMHKKGEPATMQRDPHYDDVLREVKAFLKESVERAKGAGIAVERIVVDPGFGFGKSALHNLVLLRHLRELSGLPIVAGVSRKSTLGKLTGRPVDERLAGSLAMALLALQSGAKILRVHDVRETRDVIGVWEAYQRA